MAVTVTTQSSPLGTSLVQDTSANNTAANNTLGGNPVTIYMVEVDNTANGGAASYFKMANAASAVVGTTAADLVFMIPAGTKLSFAFPTGIVFSAGVSHWCVTAAAEAGAASPGSAVVVRYVATV